MEQESGKFAKIDERFEQLDSNNYFYKKEQLEAYEMHREDINVRFKAFDTKIESAYNVVDKIK